MVVFARQRRRQHVAAHREGDVAAGDLLELAGQRVVQQEPDADGAEDLRLREPDHDRHGHHLQDAVRFGKQADGFVAEQRVADSGPVAGGPAGRRRVAGGREHAAGPVRHDQQVGGLQGLLVVPQVVFDSRRIVRQDRGLELRQIGDEPGHHRVRVDARFAKLVDEHHRRADLTLQRSLGLARDPLVDDVNRGADREHREQRAREEDPAAQGADERHLSAKSSSASPLSGTTTGCGPEETPSFHATRLYVPGGTLSMR